MKAKIDNICRSVFSCCVMLAVIGGAVVFVLFIIAIVMGGDAGGGLAVAVKSKILPYFIRSAAVAMMAGLVSCYLTRVHELSLGSVRKKQKDVRR